MFRLSILEIGNAVFESEIIYYTRLEASWIPTREWHRLMEITLDFVDLFTCSSLFDIGFVSEDWIKTVIQIITGRRFASVANDNVVLSMFRLRLDLVCLMCWRNIMLIYIEDCDFLMPNYKNRIPTISFAFIQLFFADIKCLYIQ